MKKLLRKISQFVPACTVSRKRGRQFSDLLPAAPLAPDWTLEHQVVLNRFLGSEAGQVFWARMTAVESDLAKRMVKDVMHTSHSAGVAAGFGEAVKWVRSLRTANPETISGQSSPVSEGDLAGRADGSEANDEQVPKGEESLLERLSP